MREPVWPAEEPADVRVVRGGQVLPVTLAYAGWDGRCHLWRVSNGVELELGDRVLVGQLAPRNRLALPTASGDEHEVGRG